MESPETNVHAAADLLDPALITARVDAVLAEPWYWFPVRHHSAAVAQHVEAAILARKPKLILIEGPAEADALVPYLENRKTKPPVAIYSCFEDSSNQFGLAGIASPSEEVAPRWACWFPFVEYSPELVAIRTARKIGAEVHLIDLPHYARLAAETQQKSSQSADGVADEDAGSDANDASPAAADSPRNWQTERLIADSNFYQTLSKAGGYKSWDEGWDALFEVRRFEDREVFRRELLEFCCTARATTSSEHTAVDGTLDRERHMLHSIREHIAASDVADNQVMIVCGGFHVFLDRDDKTPAPTIPDGKVYTTLVPYTNFRMSNLSGYGAGNRAPQFYQMNWEAVRGKLDNPRAHYIVSVLQAARKQGECLSAADAISVSQHARMLAAIRGRSEPILDDLHDALITCCCKGSPDDHGQRLRRAMDLIDIGTRVGSVANGVPRLPIVADFYAQLESHELGHLASQEQLERLELDKRKPEQFAVSALLHRIKFIDVPFCSYVGTQEAEFASGLIFRERWQTKWSPEVEAKLIEQNLLGDSLEAAAVNQMKKKIIDNEGNAGEICAILVSAMQMHLPGLIEQVFELAVSAIDEDARFVSLCRAVAQLAVLDRYAIYRELKRTQIAEMTERAYARACFSMLDIVSAPDDQLPQIIAGLTTLADVVLKGDDSNKSQLFSQYVAATLHGTELAMLRGALMGLCVEIRLSPRQIISDEIISFAQSPQEKMAKAGDFIHGVVSVTRASIMAGASELVDAMDQLIQAADWEVFITMLPRIRAGMELLHARHRDSLASRVAEKYGLCDVKQLQKLQMSIDGATAIVELDRKVARIMTKWSFAE